MKKISMLEFRRHADRVLKQVQQGERLTLTHRGRPVARLEPIVEGELKADDPFYSLSNLAEPLESLSNEQIDEIVYGQ